MNEQLDAIEAALRTPEPALADESFSASVLSRLPAPRRRNSARRWTLAGAAALGSALTLALAPPLESVVASLSPWSVPPLAISAVAVVAIVLVPALIVFYAERGR
jgi:hypothetical protein